MVKHAFALEHLFAKIKNKRLRTDLGDALYFIVYLIDASDKAKEKRYKEEFLRVIVLYIASIVEALCLFIIESNSLIPKKEECRNIRAILMPNVIVSSGRLVLAIQKERVIKLRDLPFSEAIKILHEKNKINPDLFKKLDLLRTIRNTQHLYSRSNASVSNKDVKNAFSSFELLLKQI